MMANPGRIASHGAMIIFRRPSARIEPHDGVGGVRPKPRKLSVASSRMTKPKSSMAITKTAIQTDGRTYLHICRIRLAPIALAAST